MECHDVADQVPHPYHWHVIRAAGITIAQGPCLGWPQVKCNCHGPTTGEPNQPLRLCPVHQPRLFALREKFRARRKS